MSEPWSCCVLWFSGIIVQSHNSKRRRLTAPIQFQKGFNAHSVMIFRCPSEDDLNKSVFHLQKALPTPYSNNLLHRIFIIYVFSSRDGSIYRNYRKISATPILSVSHRMSVLISVFRYIVSVTNEMSVIFDNFAYFLLFLILCLINYNVATR